MVARSRYRRYFQTLPADVQADVYARMRELVEEERAYCDEGNYAHMAQILTSIALGTFSPKPRDTWRRAWLMLVMAPSRAFSCRRMFLMRVELSDDTSVAVLM